MSADPFAHHPELRGKIDDPMASYFRSFQPSAFDDRMRAMGFDADWRYSDAEREARRLAFLGPRLRDDIWVFAYGSLMWNPGFRFAEVRQAHTPDHRRPVRRTGDRRPGRGAVAGRRAGLAVIAALSRP